MQTFLLCSVAGLSATGRQLSQKCPILRAQAVPEQAKRQLVPFQLFGPSFCRNMSCLAGSSEESGLGEISWNGTSRYLFRDALRGMVPGL